MVHYCVTNMPAMVPHTSTYALTNATLIYALEIADHGVLEAGQRNKRFATDSTFTTVTSRIRRSPGVADEISLAVGISWVDTVGAVVVVALLAGLLLAVGAGLEALDVGGGQLQISVQIANCECDPVLRDLVRPNPARRCCTKFASSKTFCESDFCAFANFALHTTCPDFMLTNFSAKATEAGDAAA